MPYETVFLSDLTRSISAEAKGELLKEIESQIFYFTNIKNSATLANNATSLPNVIIAMYDFGNISGLKLSAMGFAIKLKVFNFFLKQSIVLKLSDIEVTLGSSTIKL